MTTTEQQAGATEREAVERLARWLGVTEIDASRFDPFKDAHDERELLTIVQERWGRPALLEERQRPVAARWEEFRGHLRRELRARYGQEERDMGTPVDLLLAYLAPGDIARAVDAVLREYGE